MAHYMKRVATVMSLKQLRDDASASTDALGALIASEPALADSEPGPMAPVAQVGGAMLPRYLYSAADGDSSSMSSGHGTRKCQGDEFPRVPDMDECSSQSSDSAMADGPLVGHLAKGDDDISTVGSVLDLSLLAEVPQRSLLDTVTLALWEQCAEEGLFRYDVTACPTRVLPGQYGFVAQLNEGRATKKRATEFRMDQVCQPFDGSKFNFTKAYMREVLYQFEPAHAGGASGSSDGGAGGAAGPRFDEAARAGASPNLVIINVSPIEYGHVLLCPRVLDCLPQLVDPSTMALALRFAREAANPYFRVGYNSFGAFASLNHLHFQAYYLAAPLPIERAPTVPLAGVAARSDGVRIGRTTDFPVNAFVAEGGDVEAVAEAVGNACLALQAANVPHNFIICDSGLRTFLFPQCFAEKLAAGEVPEDLLDTAINPAVFEIAGHMLIKHREDYEAFDEELAWRLLEQASLPEPRFLELATDCFGQQAQAGAAAAAREKQLVAA